MEWGWGDLQHWGLGKQCLSLLQLQEFTHIQ